MNREGAIAQIFYSAKRCFHEYLFDIGTGTWRWPAHYFFRQITHVDFNIGSPKGVGKIAAV
jgi:hypothetical protein